MENETIAIALLLIIIFVSIIVIGILIYYMYSGGSDSNNTDNTEIEDLTNTINDELENIKLNTQNRRTKAKTTAQSFILDFPALFASSSRKRKDSIVRDPINYDLPNGLQFSILEPPIINNKVVKESSLSIRDKEDCLCSTVPIREDVSNILNVEFPTILPNNIENEKIITFKSISPAIVTLPNGSVSGLTLHFWNNSEISQSLKSNIDIIDQNVSSKNKDLTPGQFITLTNTGSVWIVSHKSEDNSLTSIISDNISNRRSNSDSRFQILSNNGDNISGSHVEDIETELQSLLNKEW